MRSSNKKMRKPRRKTTLGRDDAVSSTARKDYWVAQALELTPHPNQELTARVSRPIMNPRLKYSVQEAQLSANYLTSTTSSSLIPIAQGTTDITRVGDRVHIRRFRFTGTLLGVGASTSPTLCRVVIFVQGEVGAGAVNPYAASQVLQGSNSYLPLAGYSRDFGDGYQILYDSVVSVNPVSATAEAEILFTDRKVNIETEFIAAGTAASINDIRILHVCNLTSNFPVLTYQATTWFEDVDA